MNQSVTATTEKKEFRVTVSLLDAWLLSASVVLGLVHAWMGRYSMNPDGMSYLDLGDSFFHHDWAHAVNALWSPLYPWVLGAVVGIFKPSMAWEFPLVHAVNFAILVAALLAFRSLLFALLASSRQSTIGMGNPLPDWALVLVGYSIFWWIALEVQSLYGVVPDLLVVACFCLVVAMLLRVQSWELVRFGLIGVVLGIAYWAKAVMFSPELRRSCGSVSVAAIQSGMRARRGFCRVDLCVYVGPVDLHALRPERAFHLWRRRQDQLRMACVSANSSQKLAGRRTRQWHAPTSDAVTSEVSSRIRV